MTNLHVGVALQDGSRLSGIGRDGGKGRFYLPVLLPHGAQLAQTLLMNIS